MDNWQQIGGSPVMNVLKQVEARKRARETLEAADILTETARSTGNATLHRLAAKQLASFERQAEQLQLEW